MKAKNRKPARPVPSQPIRHRPGKGMVVATGPQRFFESPMEKVITAKSIVQAVLTTHDSMQEVDNYDPHWPLSIAIELLEQVTLQLDRADTEAMRKLEAQS